MIAQFHIRTFVLLLLALGEVGCHRAVKIGDPDSSDTSVIDTSLPGILADQATDTTGDGITDGPSEVVPGDAADMTGATETSSETSSDALPKYDTDSETIDTSALCGDGVVEGGERCDDGNTKSGDGCEADCSTVEAGWECFGGGDECIPLPAECGDGVLDWNEECDDSNRANDDGCTADCAVETGYNCRFVGMPCLPICGDGIVLPTEYCDDGNTDNEDACNSMCEFTDASECKEVVDASGQATGECVVPVCGNGVVEVGEACDFGSGNSDVGYGCTDQCQFGRVCGDGRVDENADEQCDYGYDSNNGMYGGCTPNCTFAPRCGDGKVQREEGEVCDVGDNLNTGNYGECGGNCQLGPYCGDGIVQDEFEDCDEGYDPVTDGHPGDTCPNSCLKNAFEK